MGMREFPPCAMGMGVLPPCVEEMKGLSFCAVGIGGFPHSLLESKEMRRTWAE